eukprot:s2757_g4.t1
MVAPGVRHSAECRRKQAEFRDLEQQLVAPQGELEDAPYSPSLGPEEPADEPADVNMEMLPEASSAPAEGAPSVAAEQSAPEFAQEDVAMDFEATDHRLSMDISMIDVCQCSEQIRIGCLTSPDLLFQERLSVESISFSGVKHSFEEVVLYSVRQCLLCGEPVEPFCDFQQELVESVFESNMVFGLLHQFMFTLTSTKLQPSCLSGRIRAPDHRAMPAEMTEVDYNPDIQSEVPEVRPPSTEVPPVPAGTPIVVDTPKEVEEPETPVPTASQVKPKVKAMPKRTIVKRKGTAKAVAVKKMPRPAVKKVKQEASESGKNVRGTFRARQSENNRKRRLAWKARQRDAMEYYKRVRQEEESRPAEVFAVERSSRGREIHRKVFNPALGRREVINITVGDRSTEGGNTKKLITSFKGFSKRPVDELRCGHCGEGSRLRA